MDKLSGRIIKNISGIYYVLLDDKNVVECSIRTTAKKNRLVVGDKVSVEVNEFNKGKYVITGYKERKSFIPRPPIANLDKLIIILSPKPEPDFLLVDKLIIYCFINNIEPVIVINKCDIADNKFIDDILKQYYFLENFVVSAKDGLGIDKVESYISNSFVALAGQSAVGKSSFINSLFPNKNVEVGELSAKIDRGKNTTRASEIYYQKDYMIADTAGFSSLDLDMDYMELSKYYPEFDKYLGKCRYLDCSHIKEGKDYCIIIDAVESGYINKDRYTRYIELYKDLKEKWEKKYD